MGGGYPIPEDIQGQAGHGSEQSDLECDLAVSNPACSRGLEFADT